jgi:hypothetical protein
MQIHVRAHPQCPAGATEHMTVDEFLGRFPEVPVDLRNELVLGPLRRRLQRATATRGQAVTVHRNRR